MRHTWRDALKQAIEEAVRRIQQHLMILGALRYIDCRKNGGSMQECMGIYQLIPPRPDGPYFKELLAKVPDAERRELLQAARVVSSARAVPRTVKRSRVRKS